MISNNSIKIVDEFRLAASIPSWFREIRDHESALCAQIDIQRHNIRARGFVSNLEIACRRTPTSVIEILKNDLTLGN
jgi:hypothetical protein